MDYETVIGIFLVLAVCSFIFGMFNHRRLVREVGGRNLTAFSIEELSNAASKAKRHAFVGYGIFMASIAIMLLLSAVFGPVAPG